MSLVCFTDCFLAQEDGSLIQKDLWIDQSRGVILDAQDTFFAQRVRPDRIVPLGGNILSPGFLDIQINGAYNFDFSVYDGDDEAYRANLAMVARRIVQTGVTSLVPTIVTQERSLYPKLLELLRPVSHPRSATMLGWHAEGPFIELAKRGAHTPAFLQKADQGFQSFVDIYGSANLAHSEDWLLASHISDDAGIRIITAAPEIPGVMEAITSLCDRGITFSIGHSIATSNFATEAVRSGARMITHLFNAMPQLHHRDPSIIGLLGASPHLYSSFTPITASLSGSGTASPASTGAAANITSILVSEALDEAKSQTSTPPLKPSLTSHPNATPMTLASTGSSSPKSFQRPFYEMIVDGIHSHPNSVRLAWSSHPDGCILITDAMKILDPDLKDGVHEWRDGKRFVKEGDKLYLEGTDTLAGSVITLDKCVRNFVHFTGCTLGEALKCVTYNPARCLGIENKKGTLRPGAHADFVVLDKAGHIQSTWVKGEMVWTPPKA